MIRNKNILSIFHTNIRSHSHNLENLEMYLTSLNLSFDIIGLSETWSILKNASNFPNNMCNYHPFEGIYGTTRNSGCGFYIKKTLNYKVRTDLNKVFYSTEQEYQALWIEIINQSGKKHYC